MPFKPDRFTKNFGSIDLEKAIEIIETHIKDQPVTLFLPATYNDATNESMDNIVKTISESRINKLLNRIIIGLDQAPTKKQYEEIVRRTSSLENRIIMWTDAPEMKRLYKKMRSEKLNLKPGKGRNVWLGLGLKYQLDILEGGRANAIILHDCDIRPETYDENIILSLMYPLVNPKADVHFVKAAYERITTDQKGRKKFAGRVVRLHLIPLIGALERTYKDISRVGEFMNYLRSFEYLLSGEFGMSPELADRIPVQTDWGLEIGTLGFLFKTPYKIAQVRIGKNNVYDHKHSEVSPSNPRKGLNLMACEVTKTILRKLYSLASERMLSDEKFQALLTYYMNEGNTQIDKYFEISQARGLDYSALEERKMLTVFKKSIINAINEFKKNPGGIKPLPSWYDANPKYRKELADIVLFYNKDYTLRKL